MSGASCPDSYVPAPSNSPTPVPTAHTWRAFVGRMVRAAWGVARSRSVQPANRFGRILNFEVGPEQALRRVWQTRRAVARVAVAGQPLIPVITPDIRTRLPHSAHLCLHPPSETGPTKYILSYFIAN